MLGVKVKTMKHLTKLPMVVAAILSILLLSMVYAEFSHAGDRKINMYDDQGNWLTMLDPGECDEKGCVLYEKTIEQWDGALIIHQFMDTDDDGICNNVTVWKPIVDPTYGTFYTVYQVKECFSSI